MKETADGLNYLEDDTHQHFESLSSLELDLSEEILVHNFEDKYIKLQKRNRKTKANQVPFLNNIKCSNLDNS